MTDEGFPWYVPGAAIIDGPRTIRLHPPEHWDQMILVIRRVPPSMNDNAIRSHWRGFHREKKSWQEEIGALLMVKGVKREHYQRAIGGATMRLTARQLAQRPDRGNFTQLVDKALGDALVTHRAIPDDDAAHYVWGGVEFEEDPGAKRTRIVLYFQPPEEG